MSNSDNHSSRMKRIFLLSRQNVGKKALPALLAGLSDSIGQQMHRRDLEDLEMTDHLRSELEQSHQGAVARSVDSFRRIFPAEESPTVFGFLSCLGHQLGAEQGYYLCKQSEYCGAARVDLERSLLRSEQLLGFDGDSLALLSLDEQNGLCLDFRADDPVEQYALTVWGQRFLGVVNGCLKALSLDVGPSRTRMLS